MAITKSYMLMSLPRPRPSPQRITSSFAAAKEIRVGGRRRRYVTRELEVSASLRNRAFSVSARTLSDSWNYFGDDEDFVDALTSWNCIGSSHGWLGYINPHNLSFYLFKPSLIKDPSYLSYIILPPIQFASHDPNAISKMAFSSSPTPIHRRNRDNNNDNASVLVAITLDWLGPAAAFCRIGDPNWTTLGHFPVESCSNNFQDITSDSKHKLFYLITDSGEIFSWDLSNYQYCQLKQQQQGKFRYLATKPPVKKFRHAHHLSQELMDNCKHYLVMEGSFLIVIRLVCLGIENYSYHIERLDIESLGWFPIKSLVYTSLFIGRNNGIAVDVRRFPGSFMPGYIYLAHYLDNYFQISTLQVYRGPGGYTHHKWKFRQADMTKDDDKMTSFPVWNFG